MLAKGKIRTNSVLLNLIEIGFFLLITVEGRSNVITIITQKLYLQIAESSLNLEDIKNNSRLCGLIELKIILFRCLLV